MRDERTRRLRRDLRLLETAHFVNIEQRAPAAKVARTKVFIAAARHRIVRHKLNRYS